MKLTAGQSNHIKYNVYLDGIKIEQFFWVADEEEGYIEIYELKDNGPNLKIISEFAKRSITKFINDNKKTVIVKMIVPWDWKNGKTEIIPAPWVPEAVKIKKYGKVELKLK